MIAVDTNVLVYAVDANEPVKGPKAVALLKSLESQETILLWQVVCEFGAALLRKKAKSDIKIDIPVVLDAWLGIYKLAIPSRHVIKQAWAFMDEHQLSYWDAVLLAACVDAGVTKLYTEDLQSRPRNRGRLARQPIQLDHLDPLFLPPYTLPLTGTHPRASTTAGAGPAPRS